MAHFIKVAQPIRSRVRHALEPRLVAATVSALALVICMFALLPETLGDKPHNVF